MTSTPGEKNFIAALEYFLNYFGIMFKLYIILSLLLLNNGTKNPQNVLLVCAKLHYFNISQTWKKLMKHLLSSHCTF